MQPDAVRVLIVEDSETDFELMVHALRRSGFAVTAVRVDREPALTEALRSFAPDIVLSDHALPQASGREVLQAIQREQPMLPVLIVTGSIDEETAADYIKAGAADFQNTGSAVSSSIPVMSSRSWMRRGRSCTARNRSNQRWDMPRAR